MTVEELAKDPTVQYLGDGVYARRDHHQIWLHTSDGIHVHNSIAIEYSTFEALRDYVRKHLGTTMAG